MASYLRYATDDHCQIVGLDMNAAKEAPFTDQGSVVNRRKTDGIQNVSDTVLIPSVLSVSQLFC